MCASYSVVCGGGGFFVVNFVAFLMLFAVGVYLLQIARIYYLGVFSVIYSLLFCLVPLCNYYLNGLWLEHPEAIYGPIDDELIFEAYTLINVCFVLLIVCYSLFVVAHRRVDKLSCLDGEYFVRVLSGWLIVIGFFIYIYSLGYGFGNPLAVLRLVYENGRMAHFNNASFSAFGMNLSYYLMSFSSLFVYLSYPHYRFNFFTLSVVLIIVVVTVVSGGRQFFMLMFSGGVAALYFKSNISIGKMALILVFVFFMLFFWQFYRAKTGEEFDLDVVVRFFTRGDVTYFYYASVEAIRQYLDYDVSFYAAFYRNLMLLPLPSEWTFGIKVSDLSRLFSYAFSSDNSYREGNYPPGLIGMFVLNFGYFGFLFIGIFLLVLFDFVERKMAPNFLRAVVIANMLFWVLQIMRGTLMGYYLIVFQVGVVFAILLVRKFFLKNHTVV